MDSAIPPDPAPDTSLWPEKPAKPPRKPAKPRAAKETKRKPKPGDKPSVNGKAKHEEPSTRGRLASEIREERVEWLMKPWFPKAMLSMIVGLPGVGKSSLVAHLVAQAGNTLILPGFEEKVEIMTLRRLRENGVCLNLVRFLDDRDYRLPRDKALLASIAVGWECELIVIDPIDSYMDDGLSEGEGKDVRIFLESAVWLAEETGAAVVAVRHPGKDVRNVMPGSRQWRAVPRSIVELFSDEGHPPKLLVKHYKDSLGQRSPPRYYSLPQEEGHPPRFLLGDWVDRTVAELASSEDGPTGRRRLIDACKLLRHMFETQDSPSVQDLVNECRRLGIGEHARDNAKRMLGIESFCTGPGAPWVMKRTLPGWPKWLLDIAK